MNGSMSCTPAARLTEAVKAVAVNLTCGFML